MTDAPPDATNEAFWTNRSVAAFAGAEDPIEAVTNKARDLVFEAVQGGWAGPPFDPIALAHRLGLEVFPRDDLSDARVVSTGHGSLRIEFNPTRPKGRLRYSIAHEIAHTFFPDVSEAARHRTGSGGIAEAAVTDEWQLELLCNVAAGELLVPSLVLPTDELDEAVTDVNRLMGLRARFDISTEAMLRRAAQATTHAVTMFAAARIGDSDDLQFRIDYAVPSSGWDAGIVRGLRIHSKVLGECTAVGFTATGTEAWVGVDSGIEAVGIPPYPGDRFPRVAGFMVRDLVTRPVGQIHYVSGDATQPRGPGVRMIAHVVNDRARAWGGAGFAMQLQRVYPQAAQAYRAWTIARPDNLRLGNVHIVELSDGTVVASMVAQEGFGESKEPRLRYSALAECLEEVRIFAERRDATVHMPRIGLGQGGGVWHLIADEIERTLSRKGVSVTVYTRPGEHLDLVMSGGRSEP